MLAHGNEKTMQGSEQGELRYLFKRRQTKGVAVLMAVAQAYRDRAVSENMFDELKN